MSIQLSTARASSSGWTRSRVLQPIISSGFQPSIWVKASSISKSTASPSFFTRAKRGALDSVTCSMTVVSSVSCSAAVRAPSTTPCWGLASRKCSITARSGSAASLTCTLANPAFSSFSQVSITTPLWEGMTMSKAVAVPSMRVWPFRSTESGMSTVWALESMA